MSDLHRVDKLVDALDSTGPRCQVRHHDVGKCVRRFDHVERGDPWHHSITGYDTNTRTGDYWRWK